MLIPQIPDELLLPIRSLAQSASILNRVFVAAASGEDASKLLVEHEETILLAEQVVNAWNAHFDLD